MNKIELNVGKILISIIVLTISFGIGYRIAATMLAGNYWETAPFYLTMFVGGFIPIIVVWATVRILISLWRKKQ